MAREDLIDIMIDADGDLMVENDDFIVTTGEDCMTQGVYTRLKSITKDWFYDHIGADLERLIGKPNTEETAMEGKDSIEKALTQYAFLDLDDIYIRPTPVSKDQIIFFVFINSPGGGDPIGFEVTLDLASGIKVREV